MALNITDEKLDALQSTPDAERTKFFNSLSQEERDQLASAVQEWKTRKAQPKAPSISADRAATLGFAQGGTFGFADEIGGAIGKLLVPDSDVKIPESSPDDTPEQAKMRAQFVAQGKAQPTSYELVRDSMRSEQERAQEQHPLAYLGGEAGGAIATALIPGGAAGNATRGVQAAQKASSLAKLGKAALAGAKIGAVYGAGASKADVAREGDVGGLIKDILGSAAFGAFVPSVLHGIGAGYRALPLIPDAVKRFAEERAVKAAGPMLKNYRELAATGRINDLGRDLLDEGIISAGNDVSAIASKANTRLKSLGEAIGHARDVIDRIIPTDKLPTGKELANRIEGDVLNELRSSPVLEQFVPAVEAYADRFHALGDTPISLNELTRWKAQMNEIISHPPDPSFPLLQKQNVARVLKDTEDEIVSHVGGAEPARAYGEAKRLYGNLANVADFAGDKALREEANRIVSPSDHAFGAVAATIDAAKGGTPAEASMWAMAMAMANKLARERGNSTAAVALDALADSAPLQWLKRLPAAQGQQYLAPLVNAAIRGPQALAATVFALAQQDPKFRDMRASADQH